MLLLRTIIEQGVSGDMAEVGVYKGSTARLIHHYLPERNVSPLNDNVHFYKGYFPDSIPPGFDELKFSFVHLDADLFEPTIEGLKYFYPRMNAKGMLVVHDYNAWKGARMAVDEFFSDKPEMPVPMPDKSGSALIVKQ